MASVTDQLAQEITNELNARAWLLSFQASRVEYVRKTLETLDRLVVSVVDAEVGVEKLSREADWHMPVILVHLQAKLTNTGIEQLTLENMKATAEQVAKHFSRLTFDLVTGEHCSPMEVNYGKHKDFDALWEERMYWGLVRLRYQVAVSV